MDYKQPKIWLGFHLLRDIGWNSIYFSLISHSGDQREHTQMGKEEQESPYRHGNWETDSPMKCYSDKTITKQSEMGTPPLQSATVNNPAHTHTRRRLFSCPLRSSMDCTVNSGQSNNDVTHICLFSRRLLHEAQCGRLNVDRAQHRLAPGHLKMGNSRRLEQWSLVTKTCLHGSSKTVKTNQPAVLTQKEKKMCYSHKLDVVSIDTGCVNKKVDKQVCHILYERILFA